MTGLEYVLAATFAVVGLVPLSMALRWERRLAATLHDTQPPPAPHRGDVGSPVRAGSERTGR